MKDHRATPFALVAVAGLALALGACGSDDDTTTTSTTTAATETTAAETTAGADDGSTTTAAEHGDHLALTAVDYAFEGIDGEVAAGTELTLHNDSTVEVHELVAFRLPDGEERTVEELVALGQEGMEALFAGPPALVLVAPPGQDAFPAVGDGTLSEPGRYLLLCTIPTGADPDAYLAAAQEAQGGPVDVPGGPPHLVQGMVSDLVVTG